MIGKTFKLPIESRWVLIFNSLRKLSELCVSAVNLSDDVHRRDAEDAEVGAERSNIIPGASFQ